MRFDDLAEINPPVPIRKGDICPFINMSALPHHARDVAEVGKKEFKGSGSRFHNGDTLIARITPCLENGKGALISSLPESVSGFGSTEFIVARARSESDMRFVYYLTRTEMFREAAISRMEGTSGRQRVSWQQIASIEIPNLRPDDREEIGDILGLLDDKIELNRRMSATLEAMARSLYRSWFVDFDPVHAKMEGRQPAFMDEATAALFPDRFGDDGLPEGWRLGKLSDLIDFNPTERISKGIEAPYLDMKTLPTSGMQHESATQRSFTSGTKFRNGDTLLARITPCLENGKTALVQGLEGDAVGWGSTEFIVMRPAGNTALAYPYCVARSSDFRDQAIASMTGSSGRQRADAGRIKSVDAAVPPREIMTEFSSTTDPLIGKIAVLGSESQTLSALRDSLLPKLMSGELRVGDARNQIEEVA